MFNAPTDVVVVAMGIVANLPTPTKAVVHRERVAGKVVLTNVSARIADVQIIWSMTAGRRQQTRGDVRETSTAVKVLLWHQQRKKSLMCTLS
jgi:hypothetical protein